MTGIDPSFRTPGAYRVLFDGRECDAFFLPSKSEWAWAVVTPMGLNMRLGGDVTVLRRLVPEAEEKVLDVPMPDWEILRHAADALRRVESQTEYIRSRIEWLLETADVLEAEHRAAQEKAKQDAAREALIEKAARIQCDGFYGPGAFDDRAPDDEVRKRYIEDCARLADAGLLAEPGGAQ